MTVTRPTEHAPVAEAAVDLVGAEILAVGAIGHGGPPRRTARPAVPYDHRPPVG
jgi:hypothetical protein